MRFFSHFRLALGAGLAAASINLACASVSSPQRSLRALGGRPVWVPICSRRGVNGSAPFFDGTSTAVMDQQACTSPSWGTVTALKLVFATFDMPPQGEIDRNVTATGTAAIFVPSQDSVSATGNAGTPTGSTALTTFLPNSFGTNGISAGQLVASGGITTGTYVTSVITSFTGGSGNTPTATTVNISSPTTSPSWSNQPFTFSGRFVPARFGGKRNFTLEPGHDVVTSDPIAVDLSPNTPFLVRTAASFSGAGMQLMDTPTAARLTVTAGSNSFAEFDSRGTALNDLTMTPVGLGHSGGGYWGPVTLLALVSPSAGQVLPGAALILGDSIAAGAGDTPDTLGLEGYIQRSFENDLPFVTAARGATTALGLWNHGDGQYALSVDTGITDVMLEAGRNDVAQFSETATELETYIQGIAARYSRAGKRVWCWTIPPSTYSSDAWTSLDNQAFPVLAYSLNASASAGATTLTLATPVTAMPIAGELVAVNGSSNLPPQAIAPGTAVVSFDGAANSMVISQPIGGALAAGTRLYFGTPLASASPVEVQREAFNSFARANYTNGDGFCTGLIDVDAIVADPGNSGKWRTDLGQASADGVHPSAVLHQAVVNSGILSPSRFPAP